MLGERSSAADSHPWYLLARDGEVVLRIRPGLHIGEDAEGDLSFAAADAQVAFDITDDGRLVLEMSSRTHAFEGPPPVNPTRFVLAPDQRAAIVFPSSTVAIDGNLVASGSAGKRLEIRVVDIPVVRVGALLDAGRRFARPGYALALAITFAAAFLYWTFSNPPGTLSPPTTTAARENDADPLPDPAPPAAAAAAEAPGAAVADALNHVAALIDGDRLPSETVVDLALQSLLALQAAYPADARILQALEALTERLASEARSSRDRDDLPGAGRLIEKAAASGVATDVVRQARRYVFAPEIAAAPVVVAAATAEGEAETEGLDGTGSVAAGEATAIDAAMPDPAAQADSATATAPAPVAENEAAALAPAAAPAPAAEAGPAAEARPAESRAIVDAAEAIEPAADAASPADTVGAETAFADPVAAESVAPETMQIGGAEPVAELLGDPGAAAVEDLAGFDLADLDPEPADLATTEPAGTFPAETFPAETFPAGAFPADAEPGGPDQPGSDTAGSDAAGFDPLELDAAGLELAGLVPAQTDPGGPGAAELDLGEAADIAAQLGLDATPDPIETSLLAAATAFANGSLMPPAQPNAFDLYLQVRALQPDSVAALEGLQGIRRTLLQRAVERLEADEIAAARRLLVEAAAAGADGGQVAMLRGEASYRQHMLEFREGRSEPYSLSDLGVVRQEPPGYPRFAPSGANGAVELEMTVTETGDVTDITVVGRPRRYFERAARRAVEQWKFEPVTINGRPVPVRTSVRLVFRG